MSKKPHHLENLGNIFGTLTPRDVPPSPAPAEAPPPVASEPATPPPKGTVGRPATGKRSSGEWQSLTVYIKKATHKRVKRGLLDSDNGQDFSELVEELLSKWADSQL